MSREWSTLSKKELIRLLESYSDDALICIGVNLKQGYVGFYDLEHDTVSKPNDEFLFILNSNGLDEWYKEDIMEFLI